MATKSIKEAKAALEAKKGIELEADYFDVEDEKMNYQEMNIKDIIKWCQDNGQVDWLKETMNTLVPYKQYPRKKVIKLDDSGNVVVGKNGKIKYTTVADKSKAPKTVMRKPNFMHIKNEFVEKFMPELKPVAQPKKPTMYDIINSL